MIDSFQNIIGPVAQQQTPGRVIISKELWQAPLTGQLVQIIKMLDTIYEPNGLIKTEEVGRIIVPSLADGSAPVSVAELRQCERCLSIVSSCSAFTCICGHTFCLACSALAEIDGTLFRICVTCDEKAKGRILYKIAKLIWG